MKASTQLLGITALCLLGACGDSAETPDEPGSSGTGGNEVQERGGPDALTGYSWQSEPLEVNGVQLQLSFEFTDTELKASNTCNGSTTVSTSTPVRYTYSANVSEGDSKKVEGDNATCDVSIASSSFDFELVDGKLQVIYQDQTLVFSPQGGNSGLFGTWKAEWDYGTLLWKMGGGKISATNECDNGLSASIEVPATFQNYFVIDQESSAGDESCSVSIAKGEVEYYFEGDDLIMVQNGEEFRFTK